MNNRKDFQGIYKNLVKKYLKRDWQVNDGNYEEDILKIEEKLKLSVPIAMREFYKAVANVDELNKLHNFLTDLVELPNILFDFKNQPEALFDVDEDWRNGEDFLIFMTENQSVAYWALKIDSMNEINPIVWQIVNDSPPEFYSEEKRFSELMVEMLNWQFDL